MSKVIRTVFLVIGVLLFVMIAWQLVFANNQGVLQTSYNALANSVNKTWGSRNGGENEAVMPSWDNSADNQVATEPTGMYEICTY